jgi:hypothetical protein
MYVSGLLKRRREGAHVLYALADARVFGVLGEMVSLVAERSLILAAPGADDQRVDTTGWARMIPGGGREVDTTAPKNGQTSDIYYPPE